MEEELTAEERAFLADEIGLGYPKEKERETLWAFFKRIIAMPDTSRTANLNEDELGLAIVPVRTNLELSKFCKHTGLTGLGTYFEDESRIITNTSLSREGFLDRLAVTTKRESELKTKRQIQPGKKRGWFKPKEEEQV